MEKIFYFCLKKTGNQQEAEDLASDISLCIFAELRKGVNPGKGIEGRFAHESEDRTVVPDILVFEGDALKQVEEAVMDHAAFETLLKNIQSAFDSTVDILREDKNDVLRTQFHYCTFMDINNIRMMTVHDEVESGRLTLPENPALILNAFFLIIFCA